MADVHFYHMRRVDASHPGNVFKPDFSKDFRLEPDIRERMMRDMRAYLAERISEIGIPCLMIPESIEETIYNACREPEKAPQIVALIEKHIGVLDRATDSEPYPNLLHTGDHHFPVQRQEQEIYRGCGEITKIKRIMNQIDSIIRIVRKDRFQGRKPIAFLFQPRLDEFHPPDYTYRPWICALYGKFLSGTQVEEILVDEIQGVTLGDWQKEFMQTLSVELPPAMDAIDAAIDKQIAAEANPDPVPDCAEEVVESFVDMKLDSES
jgi:hypothetical protein